LGAAVALLKEAATPEDLHAAVASILISPETAWFERYGSSL